MNILKVLNSLGLTHAQKLIDSQVYILPNNKTGVGLLSVGLISDGLSTLQLRAR